jgi:O-antigen ligase
VSFDAASDARRQGAARERSIAASTNGSLTLWKWVLPMLFAQCFLYKGTGFGPSVNIGLTLTPDRFLAIFVLCLAGWKVMKGELALTRLGAAGAWALVFAVLCTLSSFLMGAGSDVLYRLFDFNYLPFAVFVIGKSVPHSQQKLEWLTGAFLVIGAYLAINGIFEYRGPHSLVWPQYILDPHVGIQYGRTRGSFASSEALGQALTVCFMFYALVTARTHGLSLWRCYATMALITVVIYATNQRTSWVSFGLCLVLVTVSRTRMRRASVLFIALIFVGFFGGLTTHFSFWENATLFSRRQNTVNYRLVDDLTTMEMGRRNPLFGVGFGNFFKEWPKYFQPIPGSGIRDLEDGNHNTFLGLFAEVGLAGLVPFLMLLYLMFKTGRRVYRRSDGLERDFALVFMLVVTIYIFGGTVGDYRSGTFFNTVLFLLFGAVSAIDVELRERRGPALASRRAELGVAHARHWPHALTE